MINHLQCRVQCRFKTFCYHMSCGVMVPTCSNCTSVPPELHHLEPPCAAPTKRATWTLSAAIWTSLFSRPQQLHPKISQSQFFGCFETSTSLKEKNQQIDTKQVCCTILSKDRGKKTPNKNNPKKVPWSKSCPKRKKRWTWNRNVHLKDLKFHKI